MMAATQMSGKTLGDLLDAQILGGACLDDAFATIAVCGLALDSRAVAAGDVFLACAGLSLDGRDFIEAAVRAGAVAVLAESGERWQRNNIFQGVPVIVVEQLSKKLSYLAGRFFDHPSLALPLIGVTGTNGKTTCTHLLMQVFNHFGKSCGVIGTLGTGVDGVFTSGINTTPDAITIQKTIAQWRDSGVNAVAMEVSSHGLEQGRVAALHFEQAIFTNLTRDHMDYHGSMQAYAEAKSLLFSMPGLKVVIINGDDSYAEKLLARLPAGATRIVYSINPRSAQAIPADLWVEDVLYHADGVKARLHSPWGEFELHSPLLGAFNLSNVLAVIAAAVQQGFPPDDVVRAIAQVKIVAGRMERIPSATGITAVVDYAHTPDALRQALVAMRQHTAGKIWCVFGCGGDRDQGKRPQMGAVAQRLADHVIVTSDNPRREDPAFIINEILGGIDRPTLVEEDRAKAIQFAIEHAAAGDSVLVAGKGHEAYQQIGDNRIPYSDIKQVRLALAAREISMRGGQ